MQSTNNLPIQSDQQEALEKEQTSFAAKVADLRNRKLSVLTAELANEAMKAAVAYQKRVHQLLDPVVESAHQAHKRATTLRNQFLAPADEVLRVAKQKLSDWHNLQMREAEKKRRELEAAAREAEEKRRQEEADHLRSQGKEEDAAQVEAQEIIPIAVPVEAPSKPAGVSVAVLKKGRVVDWKLFLMWLSEQPVETVQGIIEVRESGLDRYVRAAGAPHGVEVYEQSSIRNLG